MPTLRAFSVSLLALLHLTFTSAYAGSLSYSQGSITGTAQTKKIGNLFSEDLIVLINNDQLNVQSKEDKSVVVSGTVFQVKDEGSQISGFCYLKEGKNLDEITGNKFGILDVIETRSGEKIACNIETLDQEKVIFVAEGLQNQLNMSDVRAIKSPKVFGFTARLESNNSNLDQLVFTPTFNKALSQKLQKHSLDSARTNSQNAGIAEQAVAIASVGLAYTAAAAMVIPLAIAIPVNKYREKNRNRKNSQNAELLFRLAQRRQLQRLNNNNN